MNVLRTAVLPPRIGAGIISRTRLVDHLARLAQCRLSLVQAPAGFGKSTILQQWQAALNASGELTAWLSLDRHVNDIMSHIISAFSEGVPDFRVRLSRHLATTGFVTTDGELAAVVECLSEFDARVVLLVDDAHFMPPEEMGVFERFIERLPPNAHVAVASRELPALPLARLRAHSALFEVGMNDLRFNVEETRRLFQSGAYADISDAEVEQLVERTEGWAAGLRLASLSMARDLSGAKMIASFSGSKSVVADFFSEDVFGSQSQEVRDFLLQTCQLERFSADLCNFVTNRTDSREMLNRIEALGLFLIHLDDDKSWYRYHGLFASFLSRRLTDLDSSLIPRVHLQASKWFYEQNLVIEALDHAVKSNDHAWLAELLEATCEELVYDGKLVFVVSLTEPLSEEILAAHPRILLSIAWLRIRNLRFDEAKRVIELAEAQVATGGYSESQSYAMQLMVTHRRMMLAAAEDDYVQVEELAGMLLREVGESKPYITCTLYGQTIRAQREQFKFAQFDRFEAKARAILDKSKYKFAFVAQQAIVGTTLFAMGKNDAAERALEYGMSQAIDFAGEKSPLAALPALPLADILYDRNDLSGAEDLVRDYLPVVRQFGFADEVMAGFLLAPRLHFAKGDIAGAYRALDDAKSVALELGLERLVAGEAAERIRLLLRTGHTERAIELARTSGLYEEIRFVNPQIASTTSDEVVAMTWVRLAMSQGDIGEALTLAQRWRQFCTHRGAVRHLIRWNLLVAQLLRINGDFRAAQRSLRDALVPAAEGRQTRLFLDEGVIIHELLAESYGRGPLTGHPADVFAYDLLSALENRPKARDQDEFDATADDEAGLDSKMTRRELEILTFVASGLRNREIGDRLGLTEGSVKWYMQRIYDKVGTRRRSVAVERARQFGMLD